MKQNSVKLDPGSKKYVVNPWLRAYILVSDSSGFKSRLYYLLAVSWQLTLLLSVLVCKKESNRAFFTEPVGWIDIYMESDSHSACHTVKHLKM